MGGLAWAAGAVTTGISASRAMCPQRCLSLSRFVLVLLLAGVPPATLRAAAVPGDRGAQPNPEVTYRSAPKPLPPGAVTSDWATFLGPTHNMASPETKLLRDFPADGLRVVWEMPRGSGFAAPVVQGDRLIVFHRVGDEEVVECLYPLDGRRYWRFAYASAYQDRYGYNHGPRASPVIADGRVFTCGAGGRLHALDLVTGRVLWSHELLPEFKVTQNFFGVASAPLVEGGKVIVNVGAPGGPCVVAFAADTGKQLWGAGDTWGPSYASPIPAVLQGKRRVLVFAGGESRPATGGLLCLDPENGRIDFTFPWRGTRFESVNAASPVVMGNQIFLGECYGSGGVLLEVQADGTARVGWKNPTFGMHFMTALVLGDHLYGVDGHGPRDAELVCVERATGREVWRTQPEWTETLPARGGTREATLGTYRASLLHVDGRVLCLGEYGHLLWIELSPQGYREVARTWLFAAPETWTPPVLSRGLLYVNQNARGMFRGEPPRLICYDLRAAQ